jgi:hypothetical protein
VLEDKGLRNDGTDAARTEQAGQGNKEMDKQNDQIAHRRIVAGREILRKYGQNNNSPATGFVVVDHKDEGHDFDGLLSMRGLHLEEIGFDFENRRISWKK